MKNFRTLLILCLFTTSVAYAQSLGDLAKKEEQRRAKISEEVKVLTNADTDHFKGAAITTGTRPAPPPSEETAEAKEAEGKTGEEKSEETGPLDLMGRSESFWRQTFADARQKVKELENEANVLTLKLNELQNRFYAEDNGFKQQEIQREINKTFYEQDLNKKNLQAARDALADLESEARKSGALPGWSKP